MHKIKFRSWHEVKNEMSVDTNVNKYIENKNIKINKLFYMHCTTVNEI